MAVTDCVVLKEMGLDRLNDAIAEAVADGYAPQAGVLVIQGGWYGMVMVQDDTASVTGCKVIAVDGFERLGDAIKDGVTDGYTPHSRILQAENNDLLVTLVKGSIGGGGGDVSLAWADITGKPVIIAAGATQAEARTAIGAGVGNSNLVVGTTASQAKAGNWKPTAADVTDAGAFGRQLMQAPDQAAAKTLLGIS